MTKGNIIFLNGASSSGKTVLAQTLQGMLDEMYLHLSIDRFLYMLLQRYLSPEGEQDLSPEAEQALVASIPRLVSGFHRCIEALASCGVNLIVDHVLQDPGNLQECVGLLADRNVLFVGVHCPLAELERREREREREPGTARKQHEVVHAHGMYDVEVDTSTCSPIECAEQVKEALETIGQASAFCRLRQEHARE